MREEMMIDADYIHVKDPVNWRDCRYYIKRTDILSKYLPWTRYKKPPLA